jgi:SAM-dependent methyltransferase
MKDANPPKWPVNLLPPRQVAKRHNRMTERARAWLDENLGGTYTRTCPVCTYEGMFAPYRNLLDARCPNCNSRPHHRLFVQWLAETDPITSATRLLHFAPEWGLRPILQALTSDYTSADIGERGDLQLNIEATGLPDADFDAIICHQVIEHVDDAKALAELFRILRPGGFAVLTTPVIEGWDETYENPAITTRKGRILHFGQGDHTRFYGRDFRDRMVGAGFQLEEYTAVEPFVSAHALERGGKLFIGRKPQSGETPSVPGAVT